MIGVEQVLEAAQPADIAVETRAKDCSEENEKLPSERATSYSFDKSIILYIFLK